MVAGAKSTSEAKHIHAVFYGEQDCESLLRDTDPDD
jgi:hypothetical protein